MQKGLGVATSPGSKEGFDVLLVKEIEKQSIKEC